MSRLRPRRLASAARLAQWDGIDARPLDWCTHRSLAKFQVLPVNCEGGCMRTDREPLRISRRRLLGGTAALGAGAMLSRPAFAFASPGVRRFSTLREQPAPDTLTVGTIPEFTTLDPNNLQS